MSDLISRRAAIDAIGKDIMGGLNYESILTKLPSVDAVPVVRCKNCKWGREVCGNIECSVDMYEPVEYHGYEWFCPLGERKDDEAD